MRPDGLSLVTSVEHEGGTRERIFAERVLHGPVRRLLTWIEGVEGHTERIQPSGR